MKCEFNTFHKFCLLGAVCLWNENTQRQILCPTLGQYCTVENRLRHTYHTKVNCYSLFTAFYPSWTPLPPQTTENKKKKTFRTHSEPIPSKLKPIEKAPMSHPQLGLPYLRHILAFRSRWLLLHPTLISIEKPCFSARNPVFQRETLFFSKTPCFSARCNSSIFPQMALFFLITFPETHAAMPKLWGSKCISRCHSNMRKTQENM